MPSGEIFTGPVEDSVEWLGPFYSPRILTGRKLMALSFSLKAGRVVKASAEQNQDFLLSMLDMDQGSRYLGEFAIGTN